MFDFQMEKKKKWKGEKCLRLLHPLEFTPAEGGCDLWQWEVWQWLPTSLFTALW